MQKAVARDSYEGGPGNKEAERMELHEIRIEPLGHKGDGKGVISHVTHMVPRGGQGGGPSHDVSEEKTHHPTLEHMVNHFKEPLKHYFGTKDEKETDGYEHEPGTEAED